MDKLYRHRPSPTADATLFTQFALTSPYSKTPGRLRTYDLKSDALSLLSSESRGHIRSVEMERVGCSCNSRNQQRNLYIPPVPNG